MMRIILEVLALTIFLNLLQSPPILGRTDDPLQRTLEYKGETRHYYIWLPKDYNADKTYWLLVAVHGGGGHARTNSKAISMRKTADEVNLPCIIISPKFNTQDKQLSRFPILGEGEFLKSVLTEVRKEFRLEEKILLMGKSMGGQFAHRFAFENPELIQACAPSAAGTWTTPDGKLLIERYGVVNDPEMFLSNPDNAQKVPERLHNLFDTRTARIAGRPAQKGAVKIPFLVMCGTLDTRYDIAKKFVDSLEKNGFCVETAWPQTPHTSSDEKYDSEFEKFPRMAVLFFEQHIQNKR
jgi:poly(3-hydroxybutyrate) depolymerase